MSLSPSDFDELASLVADIQKWFGGEKVSLERRRVLMDMAETALKLPDGVIASPWSRSALSGLWLANATRKGQRAVLYLHGGGYATGSSKSHRNLAAAVALAGRADALVLDYRLAPEHPFPAALNDAVEAYTALLEQRPASAITIAGDSAGGGLTVATTLALRTRGLALPGALVCMSPWLDQRGRKFSEQEQARLDDPLTTFEDMMIYSAQYRGAAAADDPLVSPLLGDLNDLPPTLIQVSGGEFLLHDSLAFAALARNTSVTLEIEDKLPHVWQWFFHRLRLGRTAIERIGRFIDERLR